MISSKNEISEFARTDSTKRSEKKFELDHHEQIHLQIEVKPGPSTIRESLKATTKVDTLRVLAIPIRRVSTRDDYLSRVILEVEIIKKNCTQFPCKQCSKDYYIAHDARKRFSFHTFRLVFPFHSQSQSSKFNRPRNLLRDCEKIFGKQRDEIISFDAKCFFTCFCLRYLYSRANTDFYFSIYIFFSVLRVILSNEKLVLNNLSAVYPSEFSMMEILEVYSLYAHTYYVIETIHPF